MKPSYSLFKNVLMAHFYQGEDICPPQALVILCDTHCSDVVEPKFFLPVQQVFIPFILNADCLINPSHILKVSFHVWFTFHH